MQASFQYRFHFDAGGEGWKYFDVATGATQTTPSDIMPLINFTALMELAIQNGDKVNYYT